MSITVNNGVANIKGTPGIIQDSFVNIPAAVDVANGTIFIDTVSLNILINLNGFWTLLYASGSTPTLQQVLNAGNTATDVGIILNDTVNNNATCEINGNYFVLDNSNPANNSVLTSYFLRIINNVDAILLYLRPEYLQFGNNSSTLVNQYIYPNPNYANQKAYIPESNGTLALQDPPFISTINTAAVTVNGTKNGIYRVATGAVTVTLQPSNWGDRKTLTFCVEANFTFVATGGATIKGVAFVNKTGLFYATYLSSFNTFYISHV